MMMMMMMMMTIPNNAKHIHIFNIGAMLDMMEYDI